MKQYQKKNSHLGRPNDARTNGRKEERIQKRQALKYRVRRDSFERGILILPHQLFYIINCILQANIA